MKNLGTWFAFVILLAVASPALMSARAGEQSGKGTIGIVCVDLRGGVHFWNAEVKTEFESCVDEVVNGWVAEDVASDADTSTQRQGLEDLIEGIESYRQSVARIKAQPKEKR